MLRPQVVALWRRRAGQRGRRIAELAAVEQRAAQEPSSRRLQAAAERGQRRPRPGQGSSAAPKLTCSAPPGRISCCTRSMELAMPTSSRRERGACASANRPSTRASPVRPAAAARGSGGRQSPGGHVAGGGRAAAAGGRQGKAGRRAGLEQQVAGGRAQRSCGCTTRGASPKVYRPCPRAHPAAASQARPGLPPACRGGRRPGPCRRCPCRPPTGAGPWPQRHRNHRLRPAAVPGPACAAPAVRRLRLLRLRQPPPRRPLRRDAPLGPDPPQRRRRGAAPRKQRRSRPGSAQ